MSFYGSVTSTVAITQTPINPVTGSFGTGKAAWFSASDTWTVPAGITAVRVRAWGAGADAPAVNLPGGGGGFAYKALIAVTPGQSVSVTVGTPGGSNTSVLGLTANNASGGTGGTATGGDVNNTGGNGSGLAGGGAANLMGAGNVTSGLGGGYAGGTLAIAPGTGLTAAAVGFLATTTGDVPIVAQESASQPLLSFDFIGTGPGGRGGRASYAGNGVNGGGGGGTGSTGGGSPNVGGNGGFPGGGGGTGSGGTGAGARGLVIIEY